MFETKICFSSLEELEEQGLTILYPGVDSMIDSKLAMILRIKRISQSLLSQYLCVPKGTLNNWISQPDRMPLAQAIKIAKILDVPLEEIFDLNDAAWATLYPAGKNYYLDLATMEMIPAMDVGRMVDNKWYDVKENKVIGNDERNWRRRRYVEENAKCPERICNREKKSLKEEFDKNVVPRFVRVVEKMEPFTID